MPLTDTAIRNTKPGEKDMKLFDGGGLYLLIKPTGARWWRLKYRFDGREKLLSLGVYPTITLRDARERRDAAKRLIAHGTDPSIQRQAAKAELADTFEAVAREWFAKQAPGWAPSHADKVLRRMELYLFPWIGSRPVGKITAPELLSCLRRVESRGKLDTALRAKQNAGQVFKYAIATGRAERDPSADLRGALAPPVRSHYATITDPTKVGALLRALDGYAGTLPVACALKLAPLVFTRPGELRKAEWAEFDLDGGQWRIPAARMKSRTPHLVPLSAQAVAILRELWPLTGRGRYLFPSRDGKGHVSENTLNAALRRLGYERGDFTAHGFRAMASTLLNEQGWSRDAIERQLAHGERDKVRAAYNHAQHLPERHRMMQAWADDLDRLRMETARIVPMRRKASGASR
ncbi:MAG: tyrosine-type recombinase/integrase [Pseudomonadota bacterium]